MIEIIKFDEYKNLHLGQWVKVYGVASERCDYIITCQVYDLETVLGVTTRCWWDSYVLEPVDEDEQPISLQDAFKELELSH